MTDRLHALRSVPERPTAARPDARPASSGFAALLDAQSPPRPARDPGPAAGRDDARLRRDATDDQRAGRPTDVHEAGARETPEARSAGTGTANPPAGVDPRGAGHAGGTIAPAEAGVGGGDSVAAVADGSGTAGGDAAGGDAVAGGSLAGGGESLAGGGVVGDPVAGDAAGDPAAGGSLAGVPVAGGDDLAGAPALGGPVPGGDGVTAPLDSAPAAVPDAPAALPDVDSQAVDDLLAQLARDMAGTPASASASAPGRAVAAEILRAAPVAVQNLLVPLGEPAPEEAAAPAGTGFGTGGVQSAGVLYAGRPLPAAAEPVVAAAPALPTEPLGEAPLPAFPSPLAGHAAPERATPLHRAAAATATLLHVAAERGITRAKLALKPVELGGIEIRLQTTAAGVAAQVIADSPEAAKLLAQAGDDLRRALEGRDVTLVSLEVSTSSEQREHARGDPAEDREDGFTPGGRATGEAGETDPALAPGVHAVIELPGGLLVDVLA